MNQNVNIFEMDSQIFRYSYSNAREVIIHHIALWVLAIQIAPMKLNQVDLVNLKLFKFLRMHRNTTSELLQLFSQIIKQNINSFSGLLIWIIHFGLSWSASSFSLLTQAIHMSIDITD